MNDSSTINKGIDDGILYVIVNGEPILEFDRKKPVPGHQRQYLDNMDAQMDQGIQLGDTFIESPNELMRSQFVANSLVNMLFKEQYSTAIAMCTYLAKRMPELQQIQCKGDITENPSTGSGVGASGKASKEKDEDNGFSIEFVFDRSFEKTQQEQTIQFHKPSDNIH